MAKVLWTQKQDIGPRPRAGHAITYDSTRQRVVLFGGDSLAGTLFGDTWEWDGENWTQVQDIGPSPRAFHAVAYDASRRRTVLFGGLATPGQLRDTWEWDGENWTQVADSGPSRRSGHAMAFDSNRQRIVLFGGESEVRLNDTWEWDGNEWVQQGDSGPSPRVYPAMAYDVRRNRLVLFGGAAENPGLGDTWEWDGTAWTEESDFGADPCAGGAMVFKGRRIALFGGIASVAASPSPPFPEIFSRSWEWDGSHWTARQDMGPGARTFHAMAFDTARARIVLFGGATLPPSAAGAADNVRGDTWEQFEEGQAAGTDVEIGSVEAVPNPVTPGDTVTITVTLSAPAAADASVSLLADGEEFAAIPIAAGETIGILDLPIPPESAPTTVTITARSGSSEASTTLTIQSVVFVDLVSIEAVPNPVAPGNTTVVTVTLAAPASEATSVSLLGEGQPFATIPIAAGATTGELDLPIPPDQAPMTFTLTARSGGSEVSTTLSIQ